MLLVTTQSHHHPRSQQGHRGYVWQLLDQSVALGQQIPQGVLRVTELACLRNVLVGSKRLRNNSYPVLTVVDTPATPLRSGCL